jgi:Spy/CpxP family protein refolding chaperone
MARILAALAILMSAGLALAQSHQPYAGLEQRTVKGLSEAQIADLQAGRGMGLALPAELNGYPGPAHVLDNADALGLTPQQRERTKVLFDVMKAEAIPMGERLIEREAKLDHMFASREITAAALSAVTADIGNTQGKLREIHLKYHLAMMDVLTPEQVAAYRDLRGYTSSQTMQQHHHH